MLLLCSATTWVPKPQPLHTPVRNAAEALRYPLLRTLACSHEERCSRRSSLSCALRTRALQWDAWPSGWQLVNSNCPGVPGGTSGFQSLILLLILLSCHAHVRLCDNGGAGGRGDVFFARGKRTYAAWSSQCQQVYCGLSLEDCSRQSHKCTACADFLICVQIELPCNCVDCQRNNAQSIEQPTQATNNSHRGKRGMSTKR